MMDGVAIIERIHARGALIKVLDYEITRYGALIAWARQIGRNDFADILEANLDEEKSADEKLNSLAKTRVNAKADGRQSASGKTPPARKKAVTRRARRKAA